MTQIYYEFSEYPNEIFYILHAMYEVVKILNPKKYETSYVISWCCFRKCLKTTKLKFEYEKMQFTSKFVFIKDFLKIFILLLQKKYIFS